MIRTPCLFAMGLVVSLQATAGLHAQYQFRTIALTGDTAPGSGGSGADVPFAGFSPASINASGEIVFEAITSTNADGGELGIFSTVGGTLDAVAFSQQLAPGSGGSGADVPFTSFYPPNINAAGEVVFNAATSTNADGGQRGIFSTVGGTLDAVAFDQQLAPGSGGSGADVPFTGFFGASANPFGEVVFYARHLYECRRCRYRYFQYGGWNARCSSL